MKTLALTLSLLVSTAGYAGSSDCDRDFTDRFLAKRECLFNGNKMECARAALTLGMTGMGALMGNRYGAAMRDPSFRDKYEKVKNLLARRNQLEVQAEEVIEKFQNEELKKLTDGEYDDHRKLARDIRVGKIEESMRVTLLAEKLVKSHHASRKKAAEFASNKSNGELGTAVKNMIDPNRILGGVTPEFRKQVAEIFPDEMKILEPDYKQMDRLLANKAEALQKGDMQTYGKIDKELADFSQKTAETSKNLKTRLVHYMISQGDSAVNVRMISGIARSIGDEEDSPAEKARRLKKSKQRAVAGGVIGGVAGLGGGMLAEMGLNYLGRKDLERCQEKLTMTKEEIAVLSRDSLAHPTKLHQEVDRVNLNCQTLFLADPSATVREELVELGYVDSGTCKLIKSEEKQLDALIEKARKLDDSECSLEDGKMKLQVSNDETVYAAYNQKNLWPNFVKAEVKKNGQWDNRSRMEFVNHYNTCHPSSPAVLSRNDQWDIKQVQMAGGVCSTATDVKAVTCALKLRVQEAFDSSGEAASQKQSGSGRAI